MRNADVVGIQLSPEGPVAEAVTGSHRFCDALDTGSLSPEAVAN